MRQYTLVGEAKSATYDSHFSVSLNCPQLSITCLVLGTVDAEPPLPRLSQRLVVQGKSLWQAVSRREILLPTVFVFLWQVGGGCQKESENQNAYCSFHGKRE